MGTRKAIGRKRLIAFLWFFSDQRNDAVDRQRVGIGTVAFGLYHSVRGVLVISMLTARYRKTDSGYMGQILEWPEVVTEGRDLEDSRASLKDALEQMVLAYQQMGKQPPAPATPSPRSARVPSGFPQPAPPAL